MEPTDAQKTAEEVAPAPKGLSEAQLDILKKARERAVAARREKAETKKAAKSLLVKQEQLSKLRMEREHKALDEELARAQTPEVQPEEVDDERDGKPKVVRRKRRPNAPIAKRTRVHQETDDMEEDSDWDDWKEEVPARAPQRAHEHPRPAMAYHRPPPAPNAFDMNAREAYQSHLQKMKAQLIYRSIWGNL